MASVQAVQSKKKAEPNPQANGKIESNHKATKKNETDQQKPIVEEVNKVKDNLSEDKEQSAMKKIKSAELFFNKKFFGNKDQSKAVMIKSLLKVPKQFNPHKLIQLKTGNLGDKIKQIETIFKAEKKTKQKKALPPPPVMTDFELYMTKRDILKEKNQIIDQIRILYEEDKQKLQAKKKQKKRRFSTEGPQTKQQKPKKIPKPQKKIQPQSVEVPNQSLPQLLFPGLYEEVQITTPLIEQPPYKKYNKNDEVNDEPVLLKKEELKPEISKPFDDEYFQKKFEEKIVKNKIKVETNFSLKSLFKSFENRKTTLNDGDFIKHELNEIEHVAKVTIDNFQIREKISRQLYGQNTDFDKIQSELTSKRLTPASIFVEADPATQRKSINWILKECDGFKKRFNVRKTKSLKNIKK